MDRCDPGNEKCSGSNVAGASTQKTAPCSFIIGTRVRRAETKKLPELLDAPGASCAVGASPINPDCWTSLPATAQNASRKTAIFAAARLLGDKLLCCCLQFGYFNKKVFASLDAFLERFNAFLAAWPDDIPVAVEVATRIG